MPPPAVMLAAPLHKPLQLTLVWAVVRVKAGGSVTVTAAVVKQLLASLTVPV